MSGWITDRLPTAEDAATDQSVWTMYNGKVVQWSFDGIKLGTPWHPIPKPAPYQNNDMSLSITEMMELILTGANGSEWALEGVMRTAIDHIKKLEKQNEMMLESLTKLIYVADNAVPVNFVKELDGVVGHCKGVLNEIEGGKV